jgi:hypothetical protein
MHYHHYQAPAVYYGYTYNIYNCVAAATVMFMKRRNDTKLSKAIQLNMPKITTILDKYNPKPN